MKKLIPSLVVAALFISMIEAYAQTPDPKYFNQPPVSSTPKVFAPGVVSLENEFEFGAVFSKDRSEFYYGVEINGKAETRMMKFENGKWTAPTTILVHDVYSFNDPFLSPDETKLFFISDRPLSGQGPKKDYDIWYVERQAGKWSQPKNAGPNVNTAENQYYISFTKTGTMYFSSNVNKNYDIYASAQKEGKFQPAEKLSTNVNTTHYEADVFVAPDESYVIFSANRPGGLGSGDLYVSFRDKEGRWSPSKSLGNAINSETDDFCPYVSPDGKYLFYASRRDIYWVSMEVVHKLK
ncbi:TolB family protein [Chryseolinea lacunae]|uniref:PD40 domain-containing protein n=1 Tax=Chryseolinea lacunae TaxID=2801331 RepID=A0ABS1KMS6_9BACT|nr:PD40 domain-containing protein [Chryseolinea lacunae]MBL0740633.1 PD40 domain-containing protein [Chryseolinea lacunae]